MTKRDTFSFFILLSTLLGGCVTQNYENDKTPVVQNQSNRDDMAATRVSLGLGYLKMGNMPQAKQNLEKAKNFAPDMVQVYTAFAHYYETVGEDKQTVESYEKALSIKSDDADTLNNYGVYLCRKDKVEEAEKQFLKAIAVPSYILVAKSYENLASCFLQIDDFTKAEAYLNKAILHSPSSASTLLQMVQLQYAMGDYKQAKLFEQRFSKMTRRFSPQSLALSYKVHYKLGQRGIAKNYGAMLVKMYPQSWEAQQYLLNELELIDADNLAKRYQESQSVDSPTSPKKRVVKLSPRKDNKLDTAEELTEEARQTSDTQVSLKIAESESVDKNLSNIKAINENKTITNTRLDGEPSTITQAQLTAAEAINDEPVTIENNPTAVVEDAPLTQSDSTEVTSTIANDTEQSLNITQPQQTEEKPTVVLQAPTQVQVDSPQIAVDEKVENENEQFDSEQQSAEDQPASQTEAKNFPKFHVVSAGDTLYSISVKYNVKINALRRWNKITKNKNLYIKDIIFLENPKLVNQ